MMKKRFGYTTTLLALALMLGGEYSAHGQNRFSEPTRTSGSSNVSTPQAGIRQDPNFMHIAGNPDPNAKNLRQSINKLAHLKAKLTEAISLKDEKITADVKVEVKDALNEHFAQDLAVRESVLARLIERADNAESQNKQRLASKDELIELQLQSYVLEKDAQGLGYSASTLNSQDLFGSGKSSTGDFNARTTRLGGAGNMKPSSALARTDVDPLLSGSVDTTVGPERGIQQNPKAMIGKARSRLAGAASTEEESQATQELKEALSVYFLRDLEERDRLLKNVRGDIEKMKQRLEKRVNSKNSIVELQFKIFVNEARGLGFFSPNVSRTTDPFAADPFGPSPAAGDLFGNKDEDPFR